MLTEQNGIQVDRFYPPVDWQYSFPDGYTRLEYLQSSGTQYINTGYVPTNTTKWVLDAQFTETTNNDQVNGRVDLTVEPAGQRINIGIARTQYITNFGFNISGGKYTTITPGDTNRHRFEIDMINGIGKVDSQQNTLSIQEIATTRSLFLFAGNNGSADLFCKEKIYSSQFFDNGILVKNFVPVKRNSDGVLGMYDLVNNVFYTNAGTGEFVMGPELYSNNSQIDIRQKNNTNFVEKYKFNANNELTWANPDLYLTGKVNYTKVGNPTITNNVVSGFSSSDYLSLPKIDNNDTMYSNFEIQVKFTTSTQTAQSDKTTSYIGLFSTYRSSGSTTAQWLELYYDGSSGCAVWYQYLDVTDPSNPVHRQIQLTNNGSGIYVSWNTTYIYKVSCVNGDCIARVYTENGTLVGEAIIPYKTAYFQQTGWGQTAFGSYKGSYGFAGSIDLSQTYIKVNNELWFYGKVNSTSNIAPVPKGFVYNNTTTPSIGIVDMRTQVFTPAPTDGIKYSQTRDIKVIPPEDNTITLLYGVASDFSKYALFGLLANTSSGNYDVYIDDVLYATTTKNTQTDIDFSALSSEYVPIGTCTTPESLVLHKIVVKPSTSGQTLTQFRCARTNGVSGTQLQGCLWQHLQLENEININFIAGSGDFNNKIIKALTAKNDYILCQINNSAFRSCETLEYLPFLRIYGNSSYLLYNCLNIKRLNLKGSSYIPNTFFLLENTMKLEQIKCTKLSTTQNGSNFKKTNIKLFPNYETSGSGFGSFLTEDINLYPTKFDYSDKDKMTSWQTTGSSTYPMRGLRGLKVSNEAPFTGTSPQINVSYTGLDRDALVELFESMPYNVGYTQPEGSAVTITDGVASNFSTSNYLQLNTFSLDVINDNYEIVTKFTSTGETWESITRYLISWGETSGRGGINITPFKHYYVQLFNDGNISISLDGGADDNINNRLTYVKLLVNNKVANLYKSLDGINWTLLVTKDLSEYTGTYIVNGANIGIFYDYSRYTWIGSIDLNSTYIKIKENNEWIPWFTGKAARAENPQINITSATGNNLTKVGTGVTIDENGVASGFNCYPNTSSYIRILGPSSFNTLEIKIKFKTGESNTGVSLIDNGGNGYGFVGMEPQNNRTSIKLKIKRQNNTYMFYSIVFLGFTMQYNTIYYGYISYRNGIYNWKVTDELNNELFNYNYESEEKPTNLRWAIGGSVTDVSYDYWRGSVDLEETYFKIDNNYLMKGYLTDNDRLIATNKGWGITG